MSPWRPRGAGAGVLCRGRVVSGREHPRRGGLHIAHTCVEHGVFVELSEAFSPSAIARATPSQQLALASPSWHFPLDGQVLPWLQLQGAFLVLYPLLEAYTALAVGEPPYLSERIDAFQQWYRRTLSQEEDDMAAEMEPTAPTSPAPVLPDLDTFPEVCPWAIEQVLAEDFWPEA